MVLSIEMGGSKVCVEKIHLHGGCHIEIEERVVRPIDDQLRRGNSEDLFGYIADCIKEVNPENGIKAGFAFSHPCALSSLRSGTLMEWTKEFGVDGCTGKDPCALLQAELHKRSLNVKIVALCNDSVSTLVAHSYKNPRAAVGVILGSGTNAAYMERVSNISKFHSEIASPLMIVNMEWGALGAKDPSVLPCSCLDEEIDLHSINPGKQHLEKMMSGMFLGELVRCWIRKLRLRGEILNHVPLTNTLFTQRMCFETPLCTTILLDDGEDLAEIEGILESFDIASSSLEERRTIRSIVDLVITRSARLMGVCLFTVLEHMGEYGLGGSVGVDGSVYKYVPGYKARMLKAMAELGMTNVECGVAEDGSCIGTALIAYSAPTIYF